MLSPIAFGQKKPRSKTVVPLVARVEYSSVYDIRNYERFSITALSLNDRKSVAAIEKVLSREQSIKPANSTAAQFFVRFREIDGMSDMEVYYLKDKKTVVVVWAENRDTKGGETELTEAFLKVLQRNKKLDETYKPTPDAE